MSLIIREFESLRIEIPTRSQDFPVGDDRRTKANLASFLRQLASRLDDDAMTEQSDTFDSATIHDSNGNPIGLCEVRWKEAVCPHIPQRDFDRVIEGIFECFQDSIECLKGEVPEKVWNDDMTPDLEEIGVWATDVCGNTIGQKYSLGHPDRPFQMSSGEELFSWDEMADINKWISTKFGHEDFQRITGLHFEWTICHDCICEHHDWREDGCFDVQLEGVNQ